MSLERINLRKLLALIYLPPRDRVSALRRDITEDRRREGRLRGSGGDFHVPFWADAKSQARGVGNLTQLTEVRIESNPRRGRLYPLLRDGFLTWWNERRRWINEPFEVLEENVRAYYEVEALGCTVKVENILAVRMDDGSYRLIYPYFAEYPELSHDAALLGLWVMNQALPEYDPNGFRILDVLRSTSFRTEDYPFQGDEEERLLREYESLLSDWEHLRSQYG
ncbi:hypothetical protein [Oricola thermophila]|uniref:Uncharacterized protein n=1 Tax=Oricola thermophila TaxID=2742145 RepID=A0A6N1VIC9_9HYPH|nr:hypothetical protein [Oricola thermophila]QKV19475.1 hypothetical protein HTY61_13925 [Oricola thermophila]